jgi:hypothetical protein
MPAEVKKEIELEIAHVLFLDIVGYSKLSVNEQHARVDELNGIVPAPRFLSICEKPHELHRLAFLFRCLRAFFALK